jgi:hypothetical protein
MNLDKTHETYKFVMLYKHTWKRSKIIWDKKYRCNLVTNNLQLNFDWIFYLQLGYD